MVPVAVGAAAAALLSVARAVRSAVASAPGVGRVAVVRRVSTERVLSVAASRRILSTEGVASSVGALPLRADSDVVEVAVFGVHFVAHSEGRLPLCFGGPVIGPHLANLLDEALRAESEGLGEGTESAHHGVDVLAVPDAVEVVARDSEQSANGLDVHGRLRRQDFLQNARTDHVP